MYEQTDTQYTADQIPRCPYYVSSDSLRITCADANDTALVYLNTFRKKVNREKQINIFCRNHYTKCEIYRIIKSSANF